MPPCGSARTAGKARGESGAEGCAARALPQGFTAEKKQYKEQKDEAERFERLQKEHGDIQTMHMLWRIYYTERGEHVCACRFRQRLAAAAPRGSAGSL